MPVVVGDEHVEQDQAAGELWKLSNAPVGVNGWQGVPGRKVEIEARKPVLHGMAWRINKAAWRDWNADYPSDFRANIFIGDKIGAFLVVLCDRLERDMPGVGNPLPGGFIEGE